MYRGPCVVLCIKWPLVSSWSSQAKCKALTLRLGCLYHHGLASDNNTHFLVQRTTRYIFYVEKRLLESQKRVISPGIPSLNIGKAWLFIVLTDLQSAALRSSRPRTFALPSCVGLVRGAQLVRSDCFLDQENFGHFWRYIIATMRCQAVDRSKS